MRDGTLRFFTVVAAGLAVAACSDDDAPTNPTPIEANFAAVASILQADCGGCHQASSGRSFLVSMDSADLVSSGFIEPENPASSLLLTKPRSSSHGGGIIAAFTNEDSSRVLSWIVQQPAVGATRLVAQRAIGTVSVDGLDVEDNWRNVRWMTTRIGGGWADATEISLKATYDNTYLYMLVRWRDDKASYRRQPFIKQADGSWKKSAAKPLPTDGTDWAAYMGTSFEEEGTSFLYEDKLAFAWNTYGASSTPSFEQNGCAGLCHDPSRNGLPGTSYYYSDPKRAAKKYTNASSEIVDLWHWKLVRQNDAYKMDDQYVRFWAPADAGAGDGGRASDAGASGYADNPAQTDGRPTYRGKTLDPGLFSFLRADTVRLTAAELNALSPGAQIASMMTYPLDGTRADIDGRGYYNPYVQTWTYEIRRKLVTGDSKDVQFDDLKREYKFGVAVFDNAQIEHSWSPNLLRFVFKQ